MSALIDISEDIENIKTYNAHLAVLMYVLLAFTLIVVTSTGAILAYWQWFDPDPLLVEYTTADNGWSQCNNRRYKLIRHVSTTKDLSIDIKEYWLDIDGMDNIDGELNEYPFKVESHYTLTSGTNRVFTFPKAVPKDLPVGRYRYRPQATYRINPIKVIIRDFPIQYINVQCSYDEKIHGVMD